TANPSHDATARDRAEREARIIASLNHPNVLAIYDVGSHHGATFLVTELVDGESLRGLKPPLRKTLEIDEQIAHHADGIVTGTVGYMAPEQIRALAVDGRADIFSFGVLLYELLTGTR